MSSLEAGSLTAALEARDEEWSELLASGDGVRVERIVSTGQGSPEGFWYDQEEDEWVAVLAGGATLELAEPEEIRVMAPGDWVLIPAHRRHRVVSTSESEPTLWLAVHFAPSP